MPPTISRKRLSGASNDSGSGKRAKRDAPLSPSATKQNKPHSSPKKYGGPVVDLLEQPHRDPETYINEAALKLFVEVKVLCFLPSHC